MCVYMYIYTKLFRYHEDSLNYYNRFITARNKYSEERVRLNPPFNHINILDKN